MKKLNSLIVSEIRERYASGKESTVDLAVAFGVSADSVEKIVNFTTWNSEIQLYEWVSLVDNNIANKRIALINKLRSKEFRDSINRINLARAQCGNGPITEKYARRTGCGKKLNWRKVEKIRNLYSLGGIAQAELARQFNVHPLTIHSILHNRSWVVSKTTNCTIHL